MTQLVTALNNYLQKPLSEAVTGSYMKILNLFEAFMSSKLMKAWEEYARNRVLSHEAQHTIKELSRLSDKELNDIGITRSQIRDVAYQTVTYR
jgi:uncharacterized protein YjiS (DUF1127 family)